MQLNAALGKYAGDLEGTWEPCKGEYNTQRAGYNLQKEITPVSPK